MGKSRDVIAAVGRGIRLLFGIMLAIILFVVLVIDKNIIYSANCMLETLAPNLPLVFFPLPWVALVLFLWFKSPFSGSLSLFCNKHFGWILGVSAVIFFVVQTLYAYCIYFYPGWDPSIVIGYADYIARGTDTIGSNVYFSVYPNNIPITFLLAVIQKLARSVGFADQVYPLCVAVSLLMVNLAGVFTALSARIMSGSGVLGLGAYGFFGLVAGLSPWITIPYTDTYSIVFPALSFYLYLKAQERKQSGWLMWLGIGLSGCMGFLIKPNAGIVLIAIAIMELVKFIAGPKEARAAVARRYLMLATAIVIMAGVRQYAISYTGSEPDENYKITLTHYIMMGLNEETGGAYSSLDYSYTMSFETVEERIAGNVQEIGNRLRNYGPIGYLQFLGKKLLTNYNDGTFSWWMEGKFLLEDFAHEVHGLKQGLRELLWRTGESYKLYATFAQAIWLLVLILPVGILLGGPRHNHAKDNNSQDNHLGNNCPQESVMYLSLLGIFAFVMLFESRGRYLYSMLPMFILCATLGLGRMKDFLKKRFFLCKK